MKKALVWNVDYNGNLAGTIMRIGDAAEIDSWSHHLLDKLDKVAVPALLENEDAGMLAASLIPAAAESWSEQVTNTVTVDPADPTWTSHPAVAAIPEYWSKTGQSDVSVIPVDPTWTHHPAVAAVAEYWSKTGVADVYVDPSDATYTHHPAVPEVSEYWSKAGSPDSFVPPQDPSWTYNHPVLAVAESWSKEVTNTVTVDPADPTWTHHPAVPEHYEIILDAAKDKVRQVSAAYNLMTKDVMDQMVTVFGTSNPQSASAYYQTWQDMIANPANYASAGLTARFAAGTLAVGELLDTAAKITEYATAKKVEADAYGVTRMQRIEQFRTDKATIMAV